jgi:hypothetical protein
MYFIASSPVEGGSVTPGRSGDDDLDIARRRI